MKKHAGKFTCGNCSAVFKTVVSRTVLVLNDMIHLNSNIKNKIPNGGMRKDFDVNN